MGGFINFIEFQKLADWKVLMMSPTVNNLVSSCFLSIPIQLRCSPSFAYGKVKTTTLQYSDTKHEKQNVPVKSNMGKIFFQRFWSGLLSCVWCNSPLLNEEVCHCIPELKRHGKGRDCISQTGVVQPPVLLMVVIPLTPRLFAFSVIATPLFH